MKQVKFKDSDGAICGGILVEKDNIIICGCCGGTFKTEEVEIIEVYNYWIDLTESIIGD